MFTDGSSVPYSSTLKLTPAQKNAAVAVVCYVGKDCSDDGKRRVLGIGLCQSNKKIQLCTQDATLAYRYVPSLLEDKLRSGSSAFAKIGESFRNNGDWDDTDDDQGNTYDWFNRTDDDYATTHIRQGMSVNLPPC